MKDEPVEFALIGHQESWRATADVFAVLRGPEYPPVPDEEIMSIVPWIPPRAVCRVQTYSHLGWTARGLLSTRLFLLTAWTLHFYRKTSSAFAAQRLTPLRLAQGL